MRNKAIKRTSQVILAPIFLILTILAYGIISYLMSLLHFLFPFGPEPTGIGHIFATLIFTLPLCWNGYTSTVDWVINKFGKDWLINPNALFNMLANGYPYHNHQNALLSTKTCLLPPEKVFIHVSGYPPTIITKMPYSH